MLAILQFTLLLTVFRRESPTYLSNKQLKKEKNSNEGSQETPKLKKTPVSWRALLMGCSMSFLKQGSGYLAVVFFSKDIFKNGETGDDA